MSKRKSADYAMITAPSISSSYQVYELLQQFSRIYLSKLAKL